MVEKELNKIVEKYSKIIENKLKSIVGVKTGNLKASIISSSSNNEIVTNMLEYGKYINPWKKKTNETDKPGYIKYIDEIKDNMITEIESKLSISIEKDVVRIIEKNNK